MKYGIFISSALKECGEVAMNIISDFVIGSVYMYQINASMADFEDYSNGKKNLQEYVNSFCEFDVLVFIAQESIETDKEIGSGIYVLVNQATTIKPRHLIREYYFKK